MIIKIVILLTLIIDIAIVILSLNKKIKSIWFFSVETIIYTRDFVTKTLNIPLLQIFTTIMASVIYIILGILLIPIMIILYLIGFKSCHNCERYIYPFEKKTERGYGSSIVAEFEHVATCHYTGLKRKRSCYPTNGW